jgi:hypothetical protein
MINKFNTFEKSILFSSQNAPAWPPKQIPFSPHQNDVEMLTAKGYRDIKSKKNPIDLMIISHFFYTNYQVSSFDPSYLLCSNDKSRELLHKMIQAMKLNPKSLFYSAISFEMSGYHHSYRAYLNQEIISLKPKMIFTLGGDTFNQLLQQNLSIMNARGKIFPHKFIHGNLQHQSKVMAIIHPEILINKPELKSLVWEDMKKAMTELLN